MNSNILTFGKFKGQRFSDTPKWYQNWAQQQPSFMARLNSSNSEPIPPKRPKYLDGHSQRSTAYEIAQFQYEMNMADKYDPSDRYGHYEGI
jgi:hypothetical protein